MFTTRQTAVPQTEMAAMPSSQVHVVMGQPATGYPVQYPNVQQSGGTAVTVVSPNVVSTTSSAPTVTHVQPGYQGGVQTTVVNSQPSRYLGWIVDRFDGKPKLYKANCCGCSTLITLWSIFCVFLILASVFMSIASDDVRGTRIHAYNEYVDTWRAFLTDEIYVTPPEVRVHAVLECHENDTNTVRNVTGTSGLALVRNTELTDVLLDNKAIDDGAKPLDPQLKYEVTIPFGPTSEADVPLSVDELKQCLLVTKFKYFDPIAEEDVIIKESMSEAARKDSYECKWRDGDNDSKDFRKRRECENRCFEKVRGEYDDERQRCYYNNPVKYVCTKTELTQSGWVADYDWPEARDKQAGCFYSKVEGGFLDERYKYDENKEKLTFTLRYSKDAWLGYMRVTLNQGKFGVRSETYLGAGIAMLVCMFVFVSLAGACTAVMAYRARTPTTRTTVTCDCCYMPIYADHPNAHSGCCCCHKNTCCCSMA